VDIDECDEGRRLAYEGTLDKGNRRAALMPQMAVQPLRLHQVEIAAADLARGHAAGEFEHRTRIVRHIGLEAGKVRAQHGTLPFTRRRWICARSGSPQTLRTWDGRD